MPVWSHCRVQNAYELNDGDRADVRMHEGTIVITYQDHGEVVEWRGQEKGDGHYLLTCAKRGGTSTLHRVPDRPILEGYWVEGSRDGFWRIHLGGDAEE